MNKFLYKLAAAKLSENAAAQGVHFCLGMLAVLWTLYFDGSLWIAAACVSVVSALIEFWFDAVYEKQPFADNFEDFAFYNLGAWGTFLILTVLE